MTLNGAIPEEAADPEDPADYERVIFTENELPGPASAVATQLSTTPIEIQRQQAIEFHTFLTSENRNLLELNSDTTARTAIIGIPGTNNVKVVYGASIGASGIGQTADTDNQVLLLQGDGGGDLGTPRPLTLPLTVLNSTDVATMTEEQFKTSLTTKGPIFTYPLVARANITTSNNLMQLAPIPPFLLYDGINRDLNAANIYERLLTINTTDTPMYDHLKNFLLACLSSHHLPNNKPYLPLETLLAPPSASALRWAGTKFPTIFPTIVTPPVQAPHQPGFDQAGLAALLAQILPLQQQALQLQFNNGRDRNNHEEEKKEDDATTYGMSQQEMAATLIMCGQAPNSHPALLPQWIRDCSEKGMTESFKLTLIRKHIMATGYFDDADVPVTSTLLKNINKRNWLGKDGNIRRPSLLNATEGLSPFIVLDLDEDEVARLNDTEDALTRASAVTMQDISSLRQRLKPKIPATAEEFMLLLKRYANLLFALFTADCPFFQCVLRVINALKDYSRVARQAMTKMARASILWIILLQSRTFALGDDTILAEFTTMHANLASKQGHIYHAEVPQALLHNDDNALTKRKQPPKTDGEPPEPKKPRSNPNCWHPTLKAKLTGPIQKAGNPSFTSILQYVDKNPSDIIHDKSSWCTPNAFFGRCFHGDKCRRQHKMVTDTQAEKILDMLSLFIAKPEELKLKGQSNTN